LSHEVSFIFVVDKFFEFDAGGDARICDDHANAK